MFTLREVVGIHDLTEMRKKDKTLFERRKCSTEDHKPIKTDRRLWVKKTIPRGLSEDRHADGTVRYLEVACCKDCGSLISWHKPLTVEEKKNRVILP
jgi:hypothetical protein